MMNRLMLLLLLTGLSLTTFAQTANSANPKSKIQNPKSTEFYPLAQIRKGQRATAYTVFEGNEPKAFELEILGVLEGFNSPKQNAIIVKLLGSDTDRTGVFAGMSGSPVYIDGKLVGAIAFAYQFSKEAIGGITPIEDMVNIFAQKQSNESAPSSPRSISFSELSFNENSREFAAFVNPPQAAMTNVSGVNAPVLKPIATPLAITGVAPEVIERFAPQFQALGLLPVAGAAGAAPIAELSKANGDTLKPGSTIVVPLVRGDLSLAAAGTVTHRDGNKIYAFGHPFLSVGVTEWPMNEGEVVIVVPSVANSFKLAKPTAMVGTLRGDRSTGIYGELGTAPTMIPVEINLKTSRGESKTYQFEIVNDRFLTPLLMQITTLSTLTGSERQIGDATLQLQSRIKLKGQEEIKLENRVSSSNAAMALTFAATQPISAIIGSGFKDLRIEKITLDVASRDVRSLGKLERLWVDRTEVKRGDKLMVHAFARTEGGGEYVERIEVQIPEDAPLGQLQLMVGDGAAVQAAEARTAFTPKTVEQLVREMNRLRKADRLYVRLSRSDNGAVINNEEMPNLPPSVLATLGSERTTGGYVVTRSVTVFEKELAPAEFVLSGSKSLTVNVVEK
jgi:SpoIVB peptidase S55